MKTPNKPHSQVRIAYVEACWHQDIVSQARLSFVEELGKHGIESNQIDVIEVAGSLEIPLLIKLLVKTGRYAIAVGAGLIVDGGIYRHDFVASTVLDAMMQVSLQSEVPVLSLVLTPIHFHEHADHHQFFFTHFNKKGAEAASACLKSLKNLQQVHELAIT